MEIETIQSNHEGALLDKLHERIDTVQGALQDGHLDSYNFSSYLRTFYKGQWPV